MRQLKKLICYLVMFLTGIFFALYITAALKLEKLEEYE